VTYLREGQILGTELDLLHGGVGKVEAHNAHARGRDLPKGFLLFRGGSDGGDNLGELRAVAAARSILGAIGRIGQVKLGLEAARSNGNRYSLLGEGRVKEASACARRKSRLAQQGASNAGGRGGQHGADERSIDFGMDGGWMEDSRTMGFLDGSCS